MIATVSTTRTRLADAIAEMEQQNVRTARLVVRQRGEQREIGRSKGAATARKARRARKTAVLAATDALLIELGVLTEEQG